jgi:UDPglucose 6-dehydrogenase|tara:strand:+ start:1065 stop:2108 length:1044 start_codon:yes stop_codon:yes gene_type:complete
MKIGFIGIGKLGHPASEFFEEKGFDVTKADIGDSIEDCVKDRQFVFVSVPTPHDPDYDGRYVCSDLEPKDFYYHIVQEVISEANKHMNKDQCLVLISTVLPGTCTREIEPLVTNTNFLYNPYLIAMGSVKEDMQNPEMIMIGGDEQWADMLMFMYAEVCDNSRYVKGTYEEIESVKIFYNTFITTKITLANMIQDVAVKLGNMNTDVVTKALSESTDRIMSPKYMKAGMGDGGSCHPRDNIALRWLAKDLDLGYDLFSSIIYAREIQAKNMAKEILKHGNKIKFSSNSFKPGVDIEDGSYSILIQRFIVELGGQVADIDPQVYVLVHQGDKPMEDVYNFDPWNNYGN